tara:strand:- start:35740 stop:36804 length:1065 start_codon:yes stop_codon:yes gene_type:complete
MGITGKGRTEGAYREGLSDTRQNELDEALADPRESGQSEAAAQERRAPVEGFNCQTMIEPIPTFDVAPCESIISGKNNSWIVLGRDRPSGRASGYGGAGHSHCGTIDLVVGRGSSKGNGLLTPAGAADDDIVAPSMFNDAARVYISQKTDCDKNFGLSPGTQGNYTAQSAVVAKADQIRLVGRGGIKIITGRAKNTQAGPGGEKMSHGAKNIRPAPKIELIAGNQLGTSRHFSLSKGLFTVERIQPAVAGDNLVEALDELIGLVNQLQGAVVNLAKEQTIMNMVMAVHTHPSTPFYTMPSPEMASAGIQNIIKMLSDVHLPLFSQKINTMFYKLTYLQVFGMRYINSSTIMISL